MGLSATQVGFLVAIPSATGSLLRIPFGAWVETTGGRKPFLTLLTLSAVGMTGILSLLVLYPGGLQSEHYYHLLLFGMLAGCGIAAFSVGIGQVSYWYPRDRQGAPLALYAGLGNVAPGLFALVLPLVIETLNLRWAYALWLGLLLAGIVVYHRLGAPAPFFQFWKGGDGTSREKALRAARKEGQELFPGGSFVEGMKITARLPQTWVLVGLYFASFGGFLALTAWLPTYWADAYGVGLSVAGGLTMVYSVLSSLIRVPGGFLSDRLGGEWTAVLSYSVMLAGAVAMGIGDSLPVAVTGAVAMAAGMGVANAAVFKMVPDYLAVGGGGAGAGWVGGLGAFGGFVLPPALGTLVDTLGPGAGYTWGFGLFAALGIVALGLTALLAWRWRELSQTPVQVVSVECPEHGERADVWAQAATGEVHAARLVRCSLLTGELDDLSCSKSCMGQVREEMGESPLPAGS